MKVILVYLFSLTFSVCKADESVYFTPAYNECGETLEELLNSGSKCMNPNDDSNCAGKASISNFKTPEEAVITCLDLSPEQFEEKYERADE